MSTDHDFAAEQAHAIDEAELLLRRLKTGEVTGFIAVATNGRDEDGLCVVHKVGFINYLQTGAMLDCEARRLFDEWRANFSTDYRRPGLAVAEGEDEGDG